MVYIHNKEYIFKYLSKIWRSYKCESEGSLKVVVYGSTECKVNYMMRGGMSVLVVN